MYTFHLEAAHPDPSSRSSREMNAAVSEVCTAVRAAGMHVGLAIAPTTPVEFVFPYVDAKLVDMVRAM